MHDNASSSSTAVNNGVTTNGVYGDDGDLIQHGPPEAVVAAVCAMAAEVVAAVISPSGAQSPALSSPSGRFSGGDDGSSAMA